MDIPLKPWEVAAANNYPLHSNTLPYVSNTDRLHSTAVPYPGSGGGSLAPTPGLSNSTQAPPLPPRPGQSPRPLYSTGGMPGYGYASRPMMSYGNSMYNSGYSGYSSPYSPYSSYSSPMGGMYGSMPGRMGMYGSINPQNSLGMDEPSFSQLAEESSASAFQSIESFVSAFGSISAMLESTFHAVYSSFRAVVGVADHLGRVKQVLSALAIFRFFRWVIRRISYLIGISKIKPEQIESLWNSLSQTPPGEFNSSEWENELKPGGRPSSWPILMFLAFIFAGPYLMWKLIRQLNLNKTSEDSKWATGEAEHFVAVAEYDLEISLSERELRLKKGQNIRLAPASHQPPNVKGWVLASDGRRIGLVPTNYIKILGKRSTNPVPSRMTHLASNNNNYPPFPSTSTGITGTSWTKPIAPNPDSVSENEKPQPTQSTTPLSDYSHLRPAVLSNGPDSQESNSNHT